VIRVSGRLPCLIDWRTDGRICRSRQTVVVLKDCGNVLSGRVSHAVIHSGKHVVSFSQVLLLVCGPCAFDVRLVATYKRVVLTSRM
jgi:hypothetical protein